jgi:hypothetical protein
MSTIVAGSRAVQGTASSAFFLFGKCFLYSELTKLQSPHANHNAPMAALIKEKTGVEVTDNILRYDSRPFDPIELAIPPDYSSLVIGFLENNWLPGQRKRFRGYYSIHTS